MAYNTPTILRRHAPMITTSCFCSGAVKVPRFQFERHSGIFATTFSLPQPVEGEEGSSDSSPFKLDGIACLDFQRLLKVLYPLTAIPKTPDLDNDEWISVLKLANLWDFIEVRNLAIQQLTSYAGSLGCVERILFARQYDVSAWLRSGYIELTRRKAVITSEEAAKIGWEVALQISQLREATVLSVLTRYLGNNPYESVDIGTVFEAEFKRVDSAHEPLSVVPRIRPPMGPPKIAFVPRSSLPHTASAFNFDHSKSATNGNKTTSVFGLPRRGPNAFATPSTPTSPTGASAALNINGVTTNPALVAFGVTTPLGRSSAFAHSTPSTSTPATFAFGGFSAPGPLPFGFGVSASATTGGASTTPAAPASAFGMSPSGSGNSSGATGFGPHTNV
ncbi:hypothetical protein MVEN_00579600 [Mycena venus]|uniref:BTB domain-containing protein n=1 Tax=Mycena venus TaxID=2733690 RepID=A0A8H6YQY3_9AGAR|nr:hypothetical protein MVEN_00579600 [Mycena venus]